MFSTVHTLFAHISQTETENNSPVHRERKFLHVLGQISEKSWKTIRPTTNTRQEYFNK